MSSFTFQAQNGGDGREYHPGSLHIRKRRDRESRTGRNDHLSPPAPPFVTVGIRGTKVAGRAVTAVFIVARSDPLAIRRGKASVGSVDQIRR